MSRSSLFARPVLQFTALHAFSLLSMLLLCTLSSAAQAKESWEGEGVEVRKGEVGKFQGETLRYDVRTRFSTLTSSHARVALVWRDKWAKEDVEQVLFEEERYARTEQYQFELDGKLATVLLTYPCPQTARDTTTECTERWEWQKNTRRFALKETTSTNPLTKSTEEIEALIKRGKLDEAREAVEVAKKRFGKESIDTEALFAAFWAITVDEAIEAGKSSPDKGIALIEAFLAKPPITSSERCPNAELVTVCLSQKQSVCGCSDPFGQLSGFEGKWPKRYNKLAKLLGKAKKPELALRLLEPAVNNLPQDADVLLVLADIYWDKDQAYKARPLYAKIRKIGIEEKSYVPERVYERYQAEQK